MNADADDSVHTDASKANESSGSRATPAVPISYLFVPGDRSERFDKALATGADRVVIDLEDAVAPARKNEARRAARIFLEAKSADSRKLVLRINAVDTQWHADDVALLQAHQGVAVMLPKAEPESLRALRAGLGPQELPAANEQRTVLALVETVAGFLQLRAVAASVGVSRLVFGSVDFHLDAGMDLDEASPQMAAVRLQFVLESRFAGLPAPVDGVCLSVDDAKRIEYETLRARSAGFGGKLCIHPRQVASVHRAMRSSAEEGAWAKRVLDAFEASGGAAVRLDGFMVDAPVAARARQILATAG